MFEASVEALTPEKAAKAPGGTMMGMNFTQFSAMMAFHELVEQEEMIIRGEWDRDHGQEDEAIPYEPEQERQLYVEMRGKLKPLANFDEWYNRSKNSHNECARANLDNSKGNLYCWVLPKFNDDGTHEPLGEHDGPWGTIKPKGKKAKPSPEVTA